MKSKVAEAARQSQGERERAMSLEQRRQRLDATMAFAIELLMASHGIDRPEAMRRIRDAGSAGRRSRCSR